MPLPAKYGGGGDGGRKVAAARFKIAGGCRGKEEEEDDNDDDGDDDDAVPRKPLRVVPVESNTAVGSRSGCWRTSQKGREKRERDKSLGGPSQANSNLSPSFCQVVVWIDALYALESQREWFDDRMLGGGDESCTTGGALYLVLEDRCTQYRTAPRRRHQGACGVGRAPRAREGQACRADGRGEGVHAWIFRETIALHVATAEGRGRGEEQGREATLPEDDHDRDLRLRVCVAQSSAGSCSSPLQRRAPMLQDPEAVASAEGVAAPDEVIGSATIAVGRCLATADRGGARNCTFSRPIRVSVVNPSGVAIGWIELGLCGSG